MPIYWHKLSPADFGTIGLTQIVINVLSPIVTFGLQDALQRYYVQWSDQDRKENIGALWMLSLILNLIICIFLEIIGPKFCANYFNNIEYAPYIRLTVWTIFFSNLANFNLVIFRARENVNSFNLVSVFTFLTQTSLAFVAIFYFEMGLEGYFFSLFVNSFFWSLWHSTYIFRNYKINLNLSKLIEPFKYSKNVAFSSLFAGFNFVFDRFFLDKFVSLDLIGIYSLANQIAGGYNALNAVFKTAWYPFIFKLEGERHDSSNIISLFATYSLAVLSIPALLITVLAKDFLVLLNSEKFLQIADYIPYFIIGYYIQTIGTAFGNGLDLAKKNKLAPLISIVTLVSGYLANRYLVELYGLKGACYAFIFVMTVRTSLQIVFSSWVYPRSYYAVKNVLVLFFGSLSYLSCLFVQAESPLSNIILKSTLIVSFSLIMLFVIFKKNKYDLELENRS